MFGSLTAVAGQVPVKNNEPASSGYGNLITESLHQVDGSILDLSTLRSTATPAGSRGRITINAADPTKFSESGRQNTAVKIFIAQWAPDATESPLPTTKAEITAGVETLSRSGFNAIRIHGFEYYLMSGTLGEFEFPPDRLDMFDWFLAECKRLGIFWIINPRQNELYQAGPSRFSMPTAAKTYKDRLFTQQDARDNWRTGFNLLYNRVNAYTGINILQDPALFLIECMNECSAQQTAQLAWPTTWMTRDSAQGTGAMTFSEWLLSTFGVTFAAWLQTNYTTIGTLNTAWGTAYASFAAVPAPGGTLLPNLAIESSSAAIDIVLYISYLDDQLAAYFEGEMAYFGYTGLYCSTISFPNAVFSQSCSRNSGNNLSNLHNYTFLAPTPANGAALTSSAQNTPVWEWESWLYTATIYTSGKPSYIGEYGWPYWGQYRNQYPILSAIAAMNGAPAVSLFYQGDFFSSQYSSSAKARVKALYPYAGHSDPAVRFAELVMFFLLNGDVTEATVTKTLTLNTRYYGTNPRNTGRINRAFYNLFLPTQLYGGLTKTRLNWTSDTSDDSLAITENAKSWATVCAEALAGTGFSGAAITAGNAGYVSSQVNNGTITAVATSGVVGSVTASLTQPVLTLSGSNTLVNGDYITITNITGTPGTWPGTNGRGTRAQILQTGVANRVQIVSGLDLTNALSGANFTSGTWSELANEMQSGTGEISVSRRRKFVAVDTAKAKFIAAGVSATLPIISGISNLVVPDYAAMFIRSMDGNPISSSRRLLLAMCGNPRNTGDTFSSSNTVLGTVGSYPIQEQDMTCSFSIASTAIGDWKLYRLGFDGQRESRDFLTGNATTGVLNVSLRTGSVNPTVFWELSRT